MGVHDTKDDSVVGPNWEPTEQDITAPSFKVAVSLAPADALKLADELLTAAGTILKLK